MQVTNQIRIKQTNVKIKSKTKRNEPKQNPNQNDKTKKKKAATRFYRSLRENLMHMQYACSKRKDWTTHSMAIDSFWYLHSADNYRWPAHNDTILRCNASILQPLIPCWPPQLYQYYFLKTIHTLY